MRPLLALALLVAIAACQDTSQWGMSTSEKLKLRPAAETAEQVALECDWIDEERELVRGTLQVASPQSTAITDAEIKRLMREEAERDLVRLAKYENSLDC